MRHIHALIIPITILFTIPFCSLGIERIEWYQPDVPPCYIETGKFRGLGHCDLTQKLVINALPEYEHQIIFSNYSRLLTALKNRSHVCSSALLYVPEREAYLIYSIPVFAGISTAVITLKDQLRLFEEFISPDMTLDMEAVLLSRKEVRFGSMKGRKLGPEIESILEPFRGTPALLERTAHDFRGLFEMLQAKRIDFILAVPMEAMYAVHVLESDLDNLVILTIKDMEKYLLLHMACSKNEWGRDVIEKVNQIIKANRDNFADFYTDWMNPSSRQIYDGIYREAFPSTDPG